MRKPRPRGVEMLAQGLIDIKDTVAAGTLRLSLMTDRAQASDLREW